MKSRNKDRKTHESIIGKIIYGFLLFMPLLAISITCAYAIFNKNAYQSTAMVEDTKYELINNQQDLENGNYYQFYTNSELLLNYNRTNINYSNITAIGGFNSTEITYMINSNTFQFYKNQNGSFLHFSVNNTSNHNYISFADANGNLTRNLIFNYVLESNDMENPYIDNISLLQFGQSNLLDNVFYYSIDKVEQSPLFNWAENSVIYTGMTNTCNAIDITTPFIPLLMTYWLIISVIYFLYDIILVILHILHKKIHQLEDSF